MIKQLVLVSSLATNGVLLAAVLRAAPAAPAAVVHALVEDSARVSNGGDAARWRALGLDERDARIVRFAELEAAARQSLPAAEPYWQAGRTARIERAAQLANAMADVRRTLEAEFGASASELPEFARAFRPFDGELDFLTAPQQLAVQTWRLAHERALAADSLELRSTPWGVHHDPSAAAVWSPDSDLDALSAILPPDAAFDVAVRTSPLAERLRATGVALDENEFRDTFASFSTAASAAPMPSEQMALRRRLRALLGPERFHRVWALRDPVAAAVRRAGGALGLSELATTSAYRILNDSQERLIELAAGGDLASEHTIAAAQSIAADEQQRLAALLGEAAATAVLDARTELWTTARTDEGGWPPQ